MEKISAVYRFVNIKNSKVYIGSSRNIHQRYRGHINELNRNDHHSILLQRSWNKHGKDAFVFEVVEIVPNISKLKEREQYWIKFYDAANPDKGYNRNPLANGSTGIIRTQETREKLRISHLGQKPTSQAIEGAKKALTGVKHPYQPRPWRLKQEVRICLCGCGIQFTAVKNDPKVYLNHQHAAKKKLKPREVRTCLCGCKETFEVIVTSPQRFIYHHGVVGRISPMKGKKHTQEALEKMSNAHRGSKRSEETKKKQSESRKKFIKENNLILPREIRVCACGCNKTFEIRKTLPNKYISGHLQILRGFSKITRTCICGCNQTFSCFSNSVQKSIFGHNVKTRSTTQDLIKEI